MRLASIPGKIARLAAGSLRAFAAGGPAGMRRHLRMRIRRWREARMDARLSPRGTAAPPGGAVGGDRGIAEEVGRQELADLLTGRSSLAVPAADRPEVSIVIPVHNKAALTCLCLRSVARCTGGPPYEVVVVDDASTDETPRLLASVGNLRVVTHRENQGFVASCNDGAAAAGGRLLCFLNNDTVVTPGWLEALARTFEEQPLCGAVGPKILSADGRLQEAGSILWGDASALGYGRGDDPSRPEYGYLRDVAYSSGACLLVERGFFAGSGGFDERYAPAYYEDTDLCLRVRAAGRRVIYQPRSAIYHVEYGSSGAAGAMRAMALNQEIFRKAWRSELSSRPLPAPEAVLRARDERRGPRILVMDDRIPTPSFGSGFPRAEAMLDALVRLGYLVTFFPLTDPTPFQPALDGLQQRGVEVFHRPYDDLPGLLAARAGLYDAVVVSRPHNAARHLSAIRRAWPGVPLVYDAEAVFSHRAILAAEYEGAAFQGARAAEMIREELAPVLDADALIVVSEADRGIVADAAGGRPIMVWGHSLEPRPGPAAFADRRGILFVGGFPVPNSPNETAVKHLVREVWPKVRGRIDATLTIAGGTPPPSVLALAAPDVEVVGFVEDLGALYDRSRLFVAPHPVAAGIPYKVHEAMSRGLPCVVSSLLGRQLEVDDGVQALVGADPAGLADRLVEGYRNEALWTGLREGGLALVRERCDPAILRARLGDFLGGPGRPAAR